MASKRRSRGWAPLVAAGGLLGWWALRRIRASRISLAGQVALVTGGSRGLGFLIARELVREGCRVAICARDPVALERARAELVADGGEVLALTCDVGDESQVMEMTAEVIARWQRIDLVFNNAGIIQVAALDALQLADFRRALDVIYWGTVQVALAVLPHMRRRRSGRIVNIASIGGAVAVPHLLPYDSAKFAVVGFSEGLRAEVARDGVGVTTVIPGLMRTGSYDHAQFKGDARGEYRWFSLAARTPVLAMNATRAARRIVRAAKLRDPELVLGLPAKLLKAMKDLFPWTTQRGLSLTNRLLPRAAGALAAP